MKMWKSLAVVLLSQALLIPVAISVNVDVNYAFTFGQEVSNAPGNMNYPSGIAIDSGTGDVFVMDELFGRVQRFDADGNFITTWNSASGLGIAVDPVDHTVYVASQYHHKIRKYDANGTLLLEWGGFGSAQGEFINPRDVAVHPVTQTVYVVDSGNDRIQEFDKNGVLIRVWPQVFNTIYGIAVDPTGQYIYGVDAGTRIVYKFDTAGVEQTHWGQIGNEPGDLRWPRSVSVDANGDVYITSTDNNEVVKFDANGVYIKSFRGPDNVTDGSFHPRAIDINTTTGKIYATSSYSYRVDRFSSDDVFEFSWGQLDTTGTNFNRPKGVAIDPNNGDIYVGDTWNAKIKRFDSNGVPIAEYGGALSVTHLEDTINYPSRLVIDSGSNIWMLNGGTFYSDDPQNWSTKYIRKFDQNGNFLMGIAEPTLGPGNGGLYYNEAGNEIYVSNTLKHKIMVFNTAGALLREFGGLGSGPGQFNRPAGIVMDHINNILYIADSGNQRIQKLDLNGNFIMQFGSAGSGQGQLGLNSQSDIDLDDYGYLYVVDTNNHRVQIFDLNGNYAGQIGANGGLRGNDSLRFPYSVSVEGNRLVVADTYNFQIEVYDLVVQPDTDGDNVADADDNCPNTSNTSQLDTDLDGLGDACDVDDDEDGVLDVDDAFPLDATESIDTDGDGLGNNADTDDDNDGLLDVDEIALGTNPLLDDTDNDGLGDAFEVIYGFNPLAGGEETLDGDGDGLNNLAEQTAGTNPTLADTDSDGLNDGDEINIHGTDPNDPDTDGDGETDGDEVSNGTDPTVADGPTGDLAPYGAPDGLVNPADILILQRMVLGEIMPTENEITLGDLNGNGSLDAGDLVLLMAIIL